MNTNDGSLEFDAYINNTRLNTTAAESERRIRGLSDTAVNEGKRMENSFGGVGAAMAAIGGTAFLGMLGKGIIDTTAKFEKFGIVLKNTLGDVEGQAALDMIAEFAATTPFQLDEVTDSFIRMANQGFVPTREEMVKLGDLASSTGKSFNQLTEAMLDAQTGEFERLKEFGIKASSNGDKVTFSFKEQETTVDKTNSAIQGYILSLGDLNGIQGANAKISEALTGQLSNLQDKFAAMFNEIGSSNSGILYGGVQAAAGLIENYEEVGKVIIALVGTYGAYRAAVIAMAVAQQLVNASSAATMYLELNRNLGALTLGHKAAATGIGIQAAAQRALNAVMAINPYVLAATALAAVALAVWALHDSTTEAEKAQEALNERMEEQTKKSEDARSEVEKNISIINDEISTISQKQIALKNLQTLYPSIFSDLDIEGVKNQNLVDVLKLVNIELEKRNSLSDKQDLSKINSILENEKNKTFSIGSEGREFLGDKAKWYDSASTINDKLRIEKQAILTKQKNEADLRKQAAFEALTNENKIDYLKKQNELLLQQSTQLKKMGTLGIVSGDNIEKEINKNNADIKKYSTPEEKKPETEAQRKAREAKEKKANAEFLKAQKEAQKLTDEFEKSKIEAQKRANDEELELNRSLITDKKKLIEFDLKQTIQGINDEEKEFKAKAKAAGVEKPDLSSFEKRRTTAESKAKADKTAIDLVDVQAEKEKLDDLLAKFQDMKQKMFTLETEYNADIDRLEKGLLGDKTDAEKEQIRQSIEERKKQFGKDSEQLKVEELMASPDWNKLFSNLDTITVSEMLKLKETVESQWANLKLSPEALKAFRDKMNEVTDTVQQRNPFKALSESIKKYKADSSNLNFKDLMKNIAASIQAVSIVFDQVVGSLDKLGIKTSEQDKQVLEDVSGMLKGAGNLAMGIATGNPMAIIQGSIDLIVNGIDLIAGAKDRKLEKSIGRHKAEVETLKIAYEQLERAIDKALGSNRYKSQKATIDNLKKQQAEYAAMARAEEDKKKTDAGKVKEYQDGVTANANAITDKINSMREEILTMDVSSAANDLGSAIIDAFTAGEDAAKAWGDKVNDIVGDVMRKMLIQKLVEEPVGNIINKYMAKWVDSEGNFLGFDAVMNSAVDMGKELTAIGPGLSSALEMLPDDIKKYITGDVSGANDNKKALSGSIKSVSEDTAGVISGQLNAMRINQADSINVLRSQLLALNQIVVNTNNLNGILTAMNTLVNGGRAHGLW